VQRAILASGEQTANARHATKLGKLIAVTGARGGVGATTVATNCAWLMANERKRRVALIDLDLQFGTVALALDLEPSHGLREALENPNRIDSLFMDRVMVQHSDKLFVLSAEEAPDEGLLLDYAALELLITELRTKFHFVVVDLPRTPSTCSHYVLQTATELVLVTDLSLAGMRDTMRLAGLMPGTNASCHLSVVANRVGEHKQGEMPRAEFEKGIGRKVEFLLPFDPRTVAAATNFGQPVAAGKGPVAMGLRDIAERIGGPAAGTAAVGRSRMWKRLLMKA
jgi:pilus assembly protein CpaE